MQTELIHRTFYWQLSKSDLSNLQVASCNFESVTYMKCNV